MDYVIVIHPAEEGGYWAEVPALEGCFAQAESIEDLLVEARVVIAAYLDALLADGQAIPDETSVIVATVKVGIPAAA
jgi:predicted RNase H-like HicB family nuclease